MGIGIQIWGSVFRISDSGVEDEIQGLVTLEGALAVGAKAYLSKSEETGTEAKLDEIEGQK